VRPRPVRIIDGGNRREGTPAIRGAGGRGRAAIVALAAAAGFAVLAGSMIGTTAAPAAAAAHSRPMFDPCPCDNPVRRPLCHVN